MDDACAPLKQGCAFHHSVSACSLPKSYRSSSRLQYSRVAIDHTCSEAPSKPLPMDPLSITAAVVGLLTAGTSVTDLLQNLRNAPELAKVVIREVESITRCLRSLQCFLDGSVTAHHSRTALIMIDEVRVVLTNCVSTISELKDSLAKLGLNGQTRIVDRLKWAAKEKAITNILLRLQSSRISMNLMLTTLNWYVRPCLLEAWRCILSILASPSLNSQIVNYL